MADLVSQLAAQGPSLPPEERVRFLDLLLESLHEKPTAGVEDAWDAEIERRVGYAVNTYPTMPPSRPCAASCSSARSPGPRVHCAAISSCRVASAFMRPACARGWICGSSCTRPCSRPSPTPRRRACFPGRWPPCLPADGRPRGAHPSPSACSCVRRRLCCTP